MSKLLFTDGRGVAAVGYTPYEGMASAGGPGSAYARGGLVREDGSGRSVERGFAALDLAVRA